MDETTINGFIEAKTGLLHELMSSPPAKDMLRLALKDIDAESGRRFIRTLLTADPEVPFAVMGSLPQAANLIVKALLELVTLVRRSFPSPLLAGFVRSLLEAMNAGDLARLRTELAALESELGPVLKEWLESIGSLRMEDAAAGGEEGGRP
jgi:hypothetical protein